LNAIFAIIGRDLRISFLHRADSLLVAGFFVITVMLFPFGIGPEPGLLERVGAGIIWVTALLATLLSLNHLFSEDETDGTLELLLTSPIDIFSIVIAKALSHWLTSGMPLIILSPLLVTALQMPSNTIVPMMLGLLLGTPTLSMIGIVGSTLTLNARLRGILMPLIILPLYIPILIFGVGCVDVESMNFNSDRLYMVLLGFLLISITLCPWAASSALKMSFE